MKGIGIIGTGAITIKHVQAIAELEDAKVVGLFNPNSESAEAARTRFIEPVFSDLDEFLEIPDLDIVCVCTPSGMHLEPSLRAIQRGKHVMIEKPLEITLGRSDELIIEAEKRGVQLAVIFQNRFAEDYQKLKKAVDDGVFGRLLMGNAYVNWYRTESYYASSKYKGNIKADGGGAFINQGIHTLDLLLDLMGDVESVYAKTLTSYHDIEAEDLGSALVTFKNGAIGNLTSATSLFPGYPEKIEIYGTQGSAILEAGKLVAWNIKGQTSTETHQEVVLGSGSSDPNAIGFQLHLAQWRHFLNALGTKEMPVVDGKTARKSVELIRAVYLSSQQNKLVRFPFED